ncbi:MAG: 3'(2'),5'-bisphosphate nucleotidase CysQ [Rubrivivax sp.]|nr:3'(2'),5'-bisphosphate nucleotidase CysQ [Rubrivivax sp.]
MTRPAIEWTEARLAALRGVAEAAGAAILGVYARLAAQGVGGAGGVAVQRKADDSPVTEADLLADRLLRARLPIMFDGAAVLSEEQAGDDGVDPERGYFLVDPLDGTKEFLARNGEFTVNVAWVQGERALAGVVHAPALGETFWGAAGVGAWKAFGVPPPGLGAAVAAAPEVQPIHVAPPPGPGATLRVLASRSHGGAAQRAYLARLPQPLVCLEAGSSLKFCRLAEGAADLYPRLTATMAWDTAAGQAVLEAAGGVVFGTEGATLRVPRRPREAPNPPFIAACCAELARRAAEML